MLKKNEGFNFKLYNHFETTDIKDQISKLKDEWSIDTSRQDVYYPHKHTESYFIYETDLNWKLNDPYAFELKSTNQTLVNLVDPIVKYLEKLHDGKRGQVLFIKLKANKSITDHEDDGDYLTSVRRHHIPIVTSMNTKFFVGDEAINMKVGDCWEINNARQHAVINNSDVDRIHLLIDIMPYAHIL